VTNIRSVSPLSFLGLNPIGVSFVRPPAFLPSPRTPKSCIVSSCGYHYLLICIETFISLWVLVSIGSNRYNGEDNDGNLRKFKGVEGFGNTQ
jgi:hypothetical protein